MICGDVVIYENMGLNGFNILHVLFLCFFPCMDFHMISVFFLF